MRSTNLLAQLRRTLWCTLWSESRRKSNSWVAVFW